MTDAGPRGAPADEEVRQLRRLTDIGRAFTYTTSLAQTAQLTVERGAALLGGSAAVLMLCDAEGLLRVRAAHGIPDARLDQSRTLLPDETNEGLRELLAVADECTVAVPLVVVGAVIGLLAVALPHAATAGDEWMLSALADQAAMSLEHARLGGEVRLEMEERLRVSAGATSAKDRALATLAHDIRSPLGAIDGYCANMEEGIYGPLTPGQRVALNRVRMSGRHLLSLLDSVLDMARLQAGIAGVAPTPVVLGEVAREAVEMLGPAAGAKRQALRLGAAPAVVVLADAARLRQVLVNLLGNAVKFTPPAGTITVVVGERDGTAGRCGEVRVTDSGPGIAEAERAAIFQPYYRSEATAVAPGIGLGLAISHALVTQLGGALEVESEVGVGSTFVIRFPLASETGDRAAAAADLTPGGPSGRGAAGAP